VPIPYRDIAETVVAQATEENMLPAVRVPISDVPDLEQEIRDVLTERSLIDEYDVNVRGEIVAVVPKDPGS
jgi:hypothetical protein